jgi:hydrogenase maturation protease
MSVVVIGYGNTLRGDDGIGIAVAEAIAALGLPEVRAIAVPQLTPELTELLAEVRLAVFVDATAEEADGVEVLPMGPADVAPSLGHMSNPRALLALTRAIYGAFPRAWLVRVHAIHFPFGEGLSPGAGRGVTEAVRAVAQLVAHGGTA